VFEFVLGVGLARWWGGRPSGQAAGVPWRTLAGLLWMAATVGILAWINSPQTPYDGNVYPSTIFFNIIVFPIGMTLFLAGLLAERSWVRWFLSTRLIHALGQRSFVFYLLHVGVFSIWWHDYFGWGRHIFLQFFATIALAEIGHRIWEEPMHRWILARTVGYKKRRDQLDISPSQG
jgi:peptidoglycan/LPS O-acetylase OafA/YrhL